MTTATLSESFGLDIDRLESWLSDAGIASGRVEDVMRLAGGTQNLILSFRCGGEKLVLRRPPPDRAGSSTTAKREATILAALAGSAVPHPCYRGLCEDAAVLGGPFLVTDEVQGFNATVEMPSRAKSDPGFRREMGLALVDGLAALAVVPLDAGLAALGPQGHFIQRQSARWAKQLEGYRTHEGWSGPAVLGPVEDVAAWLTANLPDDERVALMHGDYHIANVLFDAGSGRLAAILDWELATVGDPLLDLGRLVTTWPNARGEGLLSLKVAPWDGFPEAEELAERYASATGRSLASFNWFKVLACYKYAIILEGTHARALAGAADAAIGARLHASARGLIGRAIEIIERRA